MLKSGDRLILATHNAGKVREIRALLEPLGVDVSSAGDLGLDEPEETETTFAGNARLKAHAAAQATGLPALSDDSGIEIDALDGAPGVYTADWAETPNGRDFTLAMTKAWEACEAKSAPLPWSARFCCTLCLAFPDGSDALFEGKAEGSLTWPMRGDRGFGFDPMFVPHGHDITFAEMDPKDKQLISHRADAFAKFLAAYFPNHAA